MTRRLVLAPGAWRPADLEPAVAWLRQGGVVAFPTDTLYGLACDVRNADAVRAIFDVKGRGRESALPVIAGSAVQVEALTGPFNARERRLVSRAWPGPLSLIREAPAWMPVEVHGGAGTVAVRVPDHPVARALAEAAGTLISATSANRSGAPPTDRPDGLGVLADDPRVLVIDGGVTPGGAPSTIADVRADPPVCLREGAVPWSRVLNWLHP